MRRLRLTPRPDSARAVRRSLHHHVERGFRPDVEGMRAIAVLAVILYHTEVPGFAGGFVGVDVFFVLSGFLITRLMVGELASTGTISLGNFWARRARRILPASALVVVAVVLLAPAMLPRLSLQSLAVDTAAVGTFSANFVFASRLGGYFGAQLGASNPSPLLHYWSLAVEEQFYLVWPLVLLVLSRRPRQYRRLVLATIAALAALGFLIGLWLTATRPAWAFYLLPARMGELLAGAALAVVGTSVLAVPPRIRVALGWAGIVGILAAVVAFDESIAWPGSAVLLPVLATMAVIVAGTARSVAAGPGVVLGVPALQWIGRHSYALYLWHWPALVLCEAKWGPLGWSQRFVAIAVAVGVSVVSVRLVEDPVRHSRYLSALSWRSLTLGATLCLVVLGVSWDLRSSVGQLDGGVTAAAPQLELELVETVDVATPGGAEASAAVDPLGVAAPAAAPPSTAAEAEVATTVAVATSEPAPAEAIAFATPDAPTGSYGRLVAATQQVLRAAAAPAPVPSNLQPSLAAARDRSQIYIDGCVNIGSNSALQPCEYGVTDASRTILLYGDSHAAQWFEPLEQIALQRGFRLVVLVKGGCPVADIEVLTPVLRYTCPPYRDAAIAWIAKHQPDVVVVANAYTQYPADADTWAAGTEATVARLAEASANVVLIGDNPFSREDPPACLSSNLGDASACATVRADAVRLDRIGAEVESTRTYGVRFVDTTDWLCAADVCPPIVGNVLVLRDETHLTVPMAEFLQPLLDAALSPVLNA